MKYYNVSEAAARIRGLRNSHGYTQETVAGMLGIDRRSLSHIENATKGCSIDLFIRIAEVYHVSLDYLILGTNKDTEILRERLEAAIQQLSILRDIL